MYDRYIEETCVVVAPILYERRKCSVSMEMNVIFKNNTFLITKSDLLVLQKLVMAQHKGKAIFFVAMKLYM